MDDGRCARCDYCGQLFPISQVCLYWKHVETLEDGRGRFATGIYCSEPCGEWHAGWVGTSYG